MSEMLTDEQVAEIQARAEAATPEPWSHETKRRHGVTTRQSYVHTGDWCVRLAECYSQVTKLGEYECYAAIDNAAFIAHARQDIPALLADREELQREIVKLRQAIESIKMLVAP